MTIANLLIIGACLAIVWVALLYDYAQHRPVDFDYWVSYVENDDEPS